MIILVAMFLILFFVKVSGMRRISWLTVLAPFWVPAIVPFLIVVFMSH